MMKARKIARRTITGGTSYDVEDSHGRRVGRVDLVGPVENGRRFWIRYDQKDVWSREGECAAFDGQAPEEELVLDIWLAR